MEPPMNADENDDVTSKAPREVKHRLAVTHHPSPVTQFDS